MDMFLVWLQFLVCLGAIVLAGSHLAKYGDIIAEKTGLGRIWVGTVLLATVTSLPEIATGISSVAIVDRPDLTVGNLFGANLFNLLSIAIIDVFYRGGPLLRYVGTGVILTAAAGTLLAATAACFIFLSNTFYSFSLLNYIGYYSVLLFCLYLGTQYLITRFARRPSDTKIASTIDYGNYSLARVYLYFVLAAVIIAACGIWLGIIGDEIVEITGLKSSVVGTLFLAMATSSPEIVVSISALRLGSADLAVSNLVGSNLFNIGVIIFLDDLFYTKGPIFSSVGTDHVFSALMAIIMSCVVIMTLIYRPSSNWWKIWFGVDAIFLFLLFIAAYIVLFNL